MHTTKIEIKSTNIIMRTNAKIVDGKIKFPDEEVSYPIDLKNLKPTGGTEDSCFVFYVIIYLMLILSSIVLSFVIYIITFLYVISVLYDVVYYTM